MMTTPFDAVISRLTDASNACSEMELESGEAVVLEDLIDDALRVAHRLRDRAIRLVEDDGPDPDVQRDEQWDASFERSDR